MDEAKGDSKRGDESRRGFARVEPPTRRGRRGENQHQASIGRARRRPKRPRTSSKNGGARGARGDHLAEQRGPRDGATLGPGSERFRNGGRKGGEEDLLEKAPKK